MQLTEAQIENLILKVITETTNGKKKKVASTLSQVVNLLSTYQLSFSGEEKRNLIKAQGLIEDIVIAMEREFKNNKRQLTLAA
jgi:hypothetical protein